MADKNIRRGKSEKRSNQRIFGYAPPQHAGYADANEAILEQQGESNMTVLAPSIGMRAERAIRREARRDVRAGALVVDERGMVQSMFINAAACRAQADADYNVRHFYAVTLPNARGTGLLATFTGPKKLSVKKSDGSVEEMTADAIIVATGSVNSQPPIPGLKENPNCIDSTGALSLEKLPKSMVVIGGGVIGLELACAYAAFGTKITVVEALDHMLPMLDGDLTAIGVKHMKKMGMEFNLECPVQAVEESPVGAKVSCRNKAGEAVSFEAEKVLVAIGRKANTASLNLETAGLANDRGRIIVNDKMETNVPGVYAIGDCVKGYAQLAHTASAMGEVAAENICGMEAHYDEKTNPTCVYMEPEAASVGLTEEQCKAKGIDYKVGKFPLVANGKSLIINGGEGLVKIIADAKYEEVLGMHIIGPRATDLIAEGALALRLEATVDEIISTIHSHPTVSESVRECALNVQKRAIHIKN